MTENLNIEGNILPLEGIRVLELGSFVAAPFAARLFGDFGAEVIKIERPDGGDELRDWRKARGATSMMFRTVARNKKSVTLDLRTDTGQEAAKRIAAQCDVVIENFRPGTLEKWGLGPEVLTALNPEMVMVRISGYGQTGSRSRRPGWGWTAWRARRPGAGRASCGSRRRRRCSARVRPPRGSCSSASSPATRRTGPGSRS